MDFEEYFSAHVVPEWSSQYIEYTNMKDMLAQQASKAPILGTESGCSLRQEFILELDDYFFQLCESEATKINNFFAEKLAEAVRRLDVLKDELQYVQRTHSIKDRHGESVSTDQDVNGTNTAATTPTNDAEQNNVRQSRRQILSRRLFRKTQKKHFRDIKHMKTAFSELYLMLVLLQNYQVLNYTGFTKILAIHDDLFQITSGADWQKSHVDTMPFHTSTMVSEIMQDLETIYTNELESGDRVRAMKRLRVPPLGQKQSLSAAFRIGLFVGMLFFLLPSVFAFGLIFYENKGGKPLSWRQGLLLYRSPCLVICEIILVGINMYGWSTAGVNHVLIFEIDPRRHLTYQQLIEMGTGLLVLWFLSLIGFIVSSHFELYPFVQPLVFIALMFLFLINPFNVLYRQSRLWLLKTIAKVFAAPFYPVGFADFWLGEQITSLELVFFDLQFLFCFYASDHSWWSSKLAAPATLQGTFCVSWTAIILQTLFIILPSWFRFAQNLRRYRDTNYVTAHLVNAGKSATGFFVGVTNALRRATIETYSERPISNPYLYLWIVASIVGATYKLAWDLKMDWGFFDKNPGENKYLRDQIVYSSTAYYYAAIIENIVFRYIWVINIFVHFHTPTAEYSDAIGFFFGLIEVFRRFIWNFFRLENEHLNNCDQFRAVRDISIVPITNDVDFALIEFKLSKEPGIRNRCKTARSEIGLDDGSTTAISRLSPGTARHESVAIILSKEQESTARKTTLRQLTRPKTSRTEPIERGSSSRQNADAASMSSLYRDNITDMLTY